MTWIHPKDPRWYAAKIVGRWVKEPSHEFDQATCSRYWCVCIRTSAVAISSTWIAAGMCTALKFNFSLATYPPMQVKQAIKNMVPS